MEMADGTIACDNEKCRADLHADRHGVDLGYLTIDGKFCEDCYEVWLQTPRTEPAEPMLVSTKPVQEWLTVSDVAKELQVSPSQASKIIKNAFKSELPGVKDFASKPAGQRLGRKRHKSLLRVSPAALERLKSR
jgi:hypothetical protein